MYSSICYSFLSFQIQTSMCGVKGAWSGQKCCSLKFWIWLSSASWHIPIHFPGSRWKGPHISWSLYWFTDNCDFLHIIAMPVDSDKMTTFRHKDWWVSRVVLQWFQWHYAEYVTACYQVIRGLLQCSRALSSITTTVPFDNHKLLIDC